ncbi:MAG: Hpt domain-containing protein [Spirochaetia bacterium]|nr:Hpt domain-containing protein [Spirochaetia bacterium]
MKNSKSNIPDTDDFKEYLNDIRHSWLKTLTVLGFVLIPLFLVLDYFMIPPEWLKNFAFWRALITCLLVLQYGLLRITKPSRYAPLHGYFIASAVGLMISWMTQELGGFDSSYYAGLNLVTIAVIVLIPWGFDHAVINALIISGSYLGLNFIFPNPFHRNILVNNLYFLASTAVIAVAINRVHFQLIRKEFFTNRQLKAAKKEQDTIMDSVDEGLFIIHKTDDKYIIGEHQSDSVKKILENSQLSGNNFTDILSSYFPPKKIEELNEYLSMLSKPNIDEAMIHDLNPLEREEAAIPSGLSGVSKFLEFNFKRISESRQNSDFLISVKDVSKEVQMERQLRENEIKAEQESQMMLSILHIGPALLQDFMDGVEAEINVIESVLRDEKYHKNLEAAIETIFRSVHSLKGNAALLELKFLAKKANDFEEQIILLRDNKNLTWENFLSVAYELAKIQEVYGQLKDLIKRIQLFQSREGIDTKSALSALPGAIDKFAQNIASESGKKVRLIADEIDFTGVSNKYAYVLRDILVQLTRNALMHGIEDPETRLKSGKEETGVIHLKMKPEGEDFYLYYRDDGRSFDFDKIRQKAVAMGKGSQSDVAEWDTSRLIKLTFEPGFTTAAKSTLHSGRGMGMDIIKQRIRNLGGHLKVNFGHDKFTEFDIIFPAKALQRRMGMNSKFSQNDVN